MPADSPLPESASELRLLQMTLFRGLRHGHSPTRREAIELMLRAALIGASGPALAQRRSSPIAMRLSGPIAVGATDQVIEDVSIDAVAGRPAILGTNAARLTIRRCRIRHPVGTAGVYLRDCPGTTIEDCVFSVPNAPEAGPLERETNAVSIMRSPDCLVRRIYLRDCSTGVYATDSPHLRIEHITGENQRGPFPRGMLVQFNRSANSMLEDFFATNDVRISNTEDNVSIFFSDNCVIRRGCIDGNNSPSGVCVMFQDSHGGLCEDVDAVRFSNGAFSAYPGRNVTFLRCRARDSYRPTPRGEPQSNSLIFAASPGSADVRVRGCAYFAHVNPRNLLWDPRHFTEIDLSEIDFTPRQASQVLLPTINLV